MAAKHIAIAQERGPKSGFEFYMQQSAPTARERQGEIRSAGNRKAQFAAYCELFRDQFGPITGAGVVVQNERTDEAKDGMLQRLADKLGITVRKPEPEVDERQNDLATLVALADELGYEIVDPNAVGVQVVADSDPILAKKARKRTRKAAPKVQSTNEDGPFAKGDVFVYHSKGGSNTEWEVLRRKGTRYITTNGRRESAWKIATVESLLRSGIIEKA